MFREGINEKQRSNKIRLLILLVMVVVCETPYLSRNMNTTVVESLILLFVVIYFTRHTKLQATFASIMCSIFCYIFLELIYKFFGISSTGIGYYYATIKFLFLLLAMVCLGPYLNRKEKLLLCTVSILGMLINMASNIAIYSTMNPSAYVVYYLRGGQGTNAADTAFSTAVMLLMGTFFVISIHSYKRWLKVLSIVGMIYCAYFLIFVAQRGTTFFLGIMMIFVLLIFCASSRHMVSLLILLSILMLWLALGGAVTVLTWMSDLLANQRLNFKIDYLITFFQTGSISEAGGSLTDRFNLISNSLTTFMSSFKSVLVGVGDHRDNNLLVGNHSQIIDTLARYGVFGGSILVWLFRSMKKTIKKIGSCEDNSILHKQLMVLYVFFVARSFLGNTFVGSIGTQLFVTAPLVVSLIANKVEE